MINVPDPLDQPVTPETLRHQAVYGVFNAQTYRRALSLMGYIPTTRDWKIFLNRMLLFFGAALVVSGIMFFFAFNWQGMHRFVKLGLLEGSVVLTLGLALWLGLNRLVGKVALTAAAILMGATLAVYGQIYQTGADVYQLFALWAALIAPWVFIGRWGPLWGLWIGLLNIAWMIYAGTVGLDQGVLFGVQFLLNGVFFAFAEWAQRQPIVWLESRWVPRLLAIPTLAFPMMAAIMFVVEDSQRNVLLGILLITFLVLNSTMLYWYSRRLLDPFILIIAALTLGIWFDVSLFTEIDIDEFGLLFAGLLIILQTGGVVIWIRRRINAWEMKYHEA